MDSPEAVPKAQVIHFQLDIHLIFVFQIPLLSNFNLELSILNFLPLSSTLQYLPINFRLKKLIYRTFSPADFE